MTPSRLSRYFKGSRDNWKDKALEKQNKLRLFEQKIRDLEKSRGKWKSKAQKAEKKVKELEKELEKFKKVDKASADFQKVKTLTAISHHYTIQTIQISVQQVIEGRNSYRFNHPEVIYTDDVTHAMSNLLKHQLSQDKSYQDFLKSCHECRLELQQTELAFLAPPSQRSQCRYFNVERLVNWGKQLLNAPLEVIIELMPHANLKIIYQRLKQKLVI